ncbi:uncharacterized protein [Halyomorpha halys]|uniref:uncharacterized protein n=1 Tax=Halyomorpha halys TaxID=286706 RepID=UPI0034D28D2B
MDSYELFDYKFRVWWNEASGLMASYCICNNPSCEEEISTQGNDFIPYEKICVYEIYNIYKILLMKSRNPEMACDLVVTRLVAHHRTNATVNGGCDHGYYHNLLYIAARLAEKFQICNDYTLVELIRAIYSCERSFDRLYSGTLNTPCYRMDFGTRTTSIRVLNFLLAAAQRTKISFHYRGQKMSMANLPLSNGELPIVETGGRLAKKILSDSTSFGNESDSETDN